MIVFPHKVRYNPKGGAIVRKTVCFLLIVTAWFSLYSFNPSQPDESTITHEGTSIIGDEVSLGEQTETLSQKDYMIIVLHSSYMPSENPLSSAEHYETSNNAFLEDNIHFDYVNANISLLAPIIELEITDISQWNDEMYGLASHDNVLHIYTRIEIVLTESGWFGPPQAVDGSGGGGSSSEYDDTIKVGVYDGGTINTQYSYFDNLDIVEYDSNASVNMHTTEVAAIIANEYGNNNYLSMHTIDYHSATIIEAMNWLIVDQQVDIINISLGVDINQNDGDYGFISRYVDYLVNQYRIPVIKSSGNVITTSEIVGYDQDGNPIQGPPVIYDRITIPGTGFNVITVGGIKANHHFYEGTRRLLVDESTNSKPNIAAYSYDLISNGPDGTSYSAPRITGRVAKMMGYYPSLINKIELVYSMIHTAGNKDIVSEISGESTDSSGLHSHMGAGLFEPAFFEAIYPNLQFYSNNHRTRLQLVYYKDIVLIQDQRIIASIFTLQRMFLHPSGIYRNHMITDYQIQILFDEEVVVSSNGQLNIEMLEYQAAISGAYKIRVMMNSTPDVSQERIGFSYRIAGVEA